MVLDLEHYVAAARLAFHRLECAAAHQKFRAVFAKHLREGDAVGLVPFRLNDIDTPNPISLRHVVVLRTVSALTRTSADASCISAISVRNAPSLLGRGGENLKTAIVAIRIFSNSPP